MGLLSPDRHIVDASDLGLHPFCWPDRVTWQGRTWKKDHPVFDRERELLYFVYKDGNEYLEIAND